MPPSTSKKDKKVTNRKDTVEKISSRPKKGDSVVRVPSSRRTRQSTSALSSQNEEKSHDNEEEVSEQKVVEGDVDAAAVVTVSDGTKRNKVYIEHCKSW